MRRAALLLAALLALACAVGAADAEPRKKHRKLRGKAVAAKVVRLPGALTTIRYFAAGAPERPAAPGPGGGDPDDPPPLPPPPPPPSGSGRAVQVTSDDADPDALRLVLSRTTVLAGTVKMTFNNAFAQDPHNLVLEGPGEPVIFDELPKGEVAVRSVQLAKGTWKVYCGARGPRGQGHARDAHGRGGLRPPFPGRSGRGRVPSAPVSSLRHPRRTLERKCPA